MYMIFLILCGAGHEIRTRMVIDRYPLKIVRLPIPPVLLLQFYIIHIL